MKNRSRQSPPVRIQPDSGAVMIEAMAMFIIQNPYARARSHAGNQWLISTRMAGQMPPSATPSRNRTMRSSAKFCTRPDTIAKTSQISTMIPTNFFALHRSARCPPGICRTR